MKLYNRKFVAKSIKKRVKIAAETRDAILWDIDWANHLARVKIQGSSEYINVQFPRNFAVTPEWMKAGNAVRIIHRGGNRNLAEIVGHGGAVPTALPGAPAQPLPAIPPDQLLSGGEILATGGMTVTISAATIQIDGNSCEVIPGVYYPLEMAADAVTMSDPYFPATMGEDTGIYPYMTAVESPIMSESFLEITLGADTSYTLDAAPALGQYRYDAFAAGCDGIIDYIKGNASSSPTKPAIPANHVQIGEYILVIGGVTSIEDSNIGQLWTAREPSGLSFSVADNPFEWDDGNDYPETTVTVTVLDQYGNPLSGAYDFELNMATGSGQVWSGDSGWNPNVVSQRVYSSSSYGFKYQRDQTRPQEFMPSLYVALENWVDVSSFVVISLINEFGLEIQEVDESHYTLILQHLTSSTTVPVDWSEGIRAEITLSHNATFTFAGADDNDKLVLLVRQDGTGGYVPVWPSSVKFGSQIVSIIIDTNPNMRSYVGFIYDNISGHYDCVANVSGYPAA